MTEEIFLELLHREEGKLFRVALAIVMCEADAWDALQETVEQAWRHRKRLKGGEKAFPAWIKRILVNRSLNILRKRKQVMPIDEVEAAEPAIQVAFAAYPDDAVVWEMVKTLEDKRRQVVVLRYLGDLSLKEIAATLDIPEGTVKSRLNTAHARLREKMLRDDKGGWLDVLCEHKR